MRKLTKNEIRITILIFLITFAVTSLNLRVALRRSRDAQRRNDLGAISDALTSFHKDYGFFPPSEGGKIKICKASNFEEVMAKLVEENSFDRNAFISGLVACEWGKSSFQDVVGGGNAYLSSIPADPRESLGLSYLYLSDTEYYQIYSYLEGEDSEDTYNSSLVERGLPCGNEICSYGKSYIDIPLNISIEDYRKILEEKKRENKS